MTCQHRRTIAQTEQEQQEPSGRTTFTNSNSGTTGSEILLRVQSAHHTKFQNSSTPDGMAECMAV